jgi:hypothetical protein
MNALPFARQLAKQRGTYASRGARQGAFVPHQWSYTEAQ